MNCEDLPWEKLLDSPVGFEDIVFIQQKGLRRWFASLAVEKRHWWGRKYLEAKDTYSYEELLDSLRKCADGRIDDIKCKEMLDCMINLNGPDNPSAYYSPTTIHAYAIRTVNNGQETRYRLFIQGPYDA